MCSQYPLPVLFLARTVRRVEVLEDALARLVVRRDDPAYTCVGGVRLTARPVARNKTLPPGTPLPHEPRDERSDVPVGASENQDHHDWDCPSTWPKPPPKRRRSTWYPTHPPAQGRAERGSGSLPREPRPSRLGVSPQPGRDPRRRGWRSTWCPTHPPTQGRAERRSGWRSREPGPSRSGLSPQRSPPPSNDRAPHEERAGVGAGAARGRRGGQAPWRRAGGGSADPLAREGGWVGEG